MSFDVCMYVFLMFPHRFVCSHIWCVLMFVSIYFLCLYERQYVFMYECLYVCVYVYMFVCTCLCTYVYIYTYVCIYVHMYLMYVCMYMLYVYINFFYAHTHRHTTLSPPPPQHTNTWHTCCLSASSSNIKYIGFFSDDVKLFPEGIGKCPADMGLFSEDVRLFSENDFSPVSYIALLSVYRVRSLLLQRL